MPCASAAVLRLEVLHRQDGGALRQHQRQVPHGVEAAPCDPPSQTALQGQVFAPGHRVRGALGAALLRRHDAVLQLGLVREVEQASVRGACSIHNADVHPPCGLWGNRLGRRVRFPNPQMHGKAAGGLRALSAFASLRMLGALHQMRRNDDGVLVDAAFDDHRPKAGQMQQAGFQTPHAPHEKETRAVLACLMAVAGAHEVLGLPWSTEALERLVRHGAALLFGRGVAFGQGLQPCLEGFAPFRGVTAIRQCGQPRDGDFVRSQAPQQPITDLAHMRKMLGATKERLQGGAALHHHGGLTHFAFPPPLRRLFEQIELLGKPAGGVDAFSGVVENDPGGSLHRIHGIREGCRVLTLDDVVAFGADCHGR